MELQQLEARRKGIGGSDVAAILGISPWKTAFQVYQDKIGESAQAEQTPAMSYGLLVEPAIRQWYSNETGREVLMPENLLVHPKYPWMIASVDGLTKEPRVIEIKTAKSSQDWGEPGSDEIPPYYAAQVHHYMTVTAIDISDVIVSFAGSMPVVYTVEADKEIQEMLIEREHDFWQMVERHEPPEPVTYADVVQRFKASTDAEVTANEHIENVISYIRACQANIKAEEADLEGYKAEIMKFMGESSVLVGLTGKPIVTWKSSKPARRFDAKAFEKDHPELYSQYVKEGEASRRFLLK